MACNCFLCKGIVLIIQPNPNPVSPRKIDSKSFHRKPTKNISSGRGIRKSGVRRSRFV